MASQPRYDYDSDVSGWLFLLLFLAAVVLGALAPGVAAIGGLLLALPGFVLAPWTAPRGDNDGLWVLIIPMMGVLMLILAGVAGLVAWLRGVIESFVRRFGDRP